MGMQGGTVKMMAKYQNQCYHKRYVLVKIQFQVIEKEGDRLREDRKWGIGGQKLGKVAPGVTRTTHSELVNGKRGGTGHFSGNGGAALEGLRRQPRILAYPASLLRSSPRSDHPHQAQTASLRLAATAPTPPSLHKRQKGWATLERSGGTNVGRPPSTFLVVGETACTARYHMIPFVNAWGNVVSNVQFEVVIVRAR